MSEREPPKSAQPELLAHVGDWKDTFHDEHESVAQFVERITRDSNRVRPEALRGHCPTFLHYYVGGSDEKFSTFLEYLVNRMAITKNELREIEVDQRTGDINTALERMQDDQILDDPKRRLLFVVRGFDLYIRGLIEQQLEGKIARAAHDVDQNAGELLPKPAHLRYSNRDAPIIVLVHISDRFGANVEHAALGSAGESQFKIGVFQIE